MPPLILPRSEHPVSRKNIDPDALKVLYRLKSAGHIAYLVGGSVRDLLLGRQPKDFDIATSALPNEIRRLFRNCRLIGRRFRLAHVVFGRNKIVEVSTFRRKSDERSEESGDLLVRRDNTFGSPEEDAERRDFTTNGLFYDIATFSVIDWVGGLRDVEERTIRTIGDPAIRYREDPVRMLRAVKFAARLDFRIADEDLQAIERYRAELMRSAPERLRLELGRLLSGGHALRSVELLEQTGLLEVVAPEVGAILEARKQAGTEQPIRSLVDLVGLDRLVEQRRRQGPADELPQAVLFGALLVPVALSERAAAPPPREPILRRGLGFAAGPELAEIAASGAEEEGGEPIPGEPIGPEPAEPAPPLPAAEEQWLEAREDESAVEGEAFDAGAAPVAGEAIRDNEPEPAEQARPPQRSDLPVFAGGDPAADVEERLTSFLLRFSMPRRETERLLQILAAQRRLLSPGRRSPVHVRLARKDYFPDALLLLECHVLGSGRGEADLRMWKAMAERVPPERSTGRPGGEEGERRRRRGRRGRGRRGGLAPGGGTGEERFSLPAADGEGVPFPAPEPAAGEEDDEAYEARLRRKAELDQMRREQAFQPGRWGGVGPDVAARPLAIPGGRVHIDPSSPMGSPIGFAAERDRPRRRRRRGGRGRGGAPDDGGAAPSGGPE